MDLSSEVADSGHLSTQLTQAMHKAASTDPETETKTLAEQPTWSQQGQSAVPGGRAWPPIGREIRGPLPAVAPPGLSSPGGVEPGLPGALKQGSSSGMDSMRTGLQHALNLSSANAPKGTITLQRRTRGTRNLPSSI